MYLEPSFFGNGHTVCHPISLRIQYHRIISVAHEYDIRKDSFLFHMIEERDFSEPARLWLLGFKSKADSKRLEYFLLNQDPHLIVICKRKRMKSIPSKII